MQTIPTIAEVERELGERLGFVALSKAITPIPPMANMIPAESPSIIYCPFTRYLRNTTGFTAPVLSSRSVPIDGGSVIKSYTTPEMTIKYDKKISEKTIIGLGLGRLGNVKLRRGARTNLKGASRMAAILSPQTSSPIKARADTQKGDVM